MSVITIGSFGAPNSNEFISAQGILSNHLIMKQCQVAKLLTARRTQTITRTNLNFGGFTCSTTKSLFEKDIKHSIHHRFFSLQ